MTWHFRVPEAVRKFRVFRSGAVALRGPDSQDIPLTAEVPGWSEVTVRPEQAGHLWSLRAPRAAFVELRGVPPVLGADRRERLFLPDLTAIQLDRFGMKRDYGFTDRSVLPDDATFVSTGNESAKAVALAAGRAVLVERGKRLGEGRFENFNCREGTLELWLKPDWSSVYQPRTRAAIQDGLRPLAPKRLPKQMTVRWRSSSSTGFWTGSAEPARHRSGPSS